MLMKRLFLLIVCTMLLSACSLKQIPEIDIDSKEYETDISSVYAETVQFAGFENDEFERQINESITRDISGALVSFDTMVSESTDNIRMGNRCVLEIKQFVKNNNNDFISVIEEHYVYTGGAHGSTAWYPRNIDLSAGKTILLSDLFSDDSYKNELNRQIDTILENNKEEYTDLWSHPKIDSEENFYISDGKLVIFYPPYELSYYARGFVEFPIKLSDIEGYLKDEYKRLIK